MIIGITSLYTVCKLYLARVVESRTERKVYDEHKSLSWGLEVHKGRGKFGIGEDNFSLRYVEFVELWVLFSGFDAGKPWEYINALEKW